MPLQFAPNPAGCQHCAAIDQRIQEKREELMRCTKPELDCWLQNPVVSQYVYARLNNLGGTIFDHVAASVCYMEGMNDCPIHGP